MSLLDTLKGALSSVDFSGIGSKAVGTAAAVVAKPVTDKVAETADQVTESVKRVVKDVDQAVTIGETYVATQLTLQAIATAAAVGMFFVQYSAFQKAKKIKRIRINPGSKRKKKRRR